MTKHTNHLAHRSEAIKVNNQLPQGLRAYFDEQTQQTLAFQQVVAQVVSTEMATLCHVVRYFNGELIVSSPNLTLINHLRRLLPILINTLQSHQDFKNLNKINLVYFCPSSLANTTLKTC